MNRGPTTDTPWVLAIDIGTSSARAIVFNSAGAAVPELRCQEEYEPESNEPGAATFDADLLVTAVQTCIDEVLARAGARAENISAVGVTTFWHSMVGVDARGTAITPLYTWADTRPAAAAASLKHRLDPGSYHARTGCALHPSYFPARLAWLREADPSLYARVDRWLSPGEYLYLRLFGHARCSISMASATGLFHQSDCDWDALTLTALDLPKDRLSLLTDLDSPVTGLGGEFASRWPALARVPWAPPIGDGAASNLGSGCATERKVAINIGTSAAIRVLFRADRVEVPSALWCYRLDSERFLFGGAYSDGGSAAAWLRDTLALGDFTRTLAEVEQMVPDSHGLTILPFLSGERSIGWRPEARATLHGLTFRSTPAEILRAGLEAVALRFAPVHASLRERFPGANEIIAAGGAFKQMEFWAQILADALGETVLLSAETEATSRGAAAVALRLAGAIKDEDELPAPSTRRFEPIPDHNAVYRNALDRQQGLYEALLGL